MASFPAWPASTTSRSCRAISRWARASSSLARMPGSSTPAQRSAPASCTSCTTEASPVVAIIGERLSEPIGVAIDDIDLSRPLSGAARDRIVTALLDRHVVVFPGQALSREQQYAFTAQFGEVESHGGGRPGNRQDVAHVTALLGACLNPLDRVSQGPNTRGRPHKPYADPPPPLS